MQHAYGTYRTTLLDKQLRELAKADRKAAVAAERAERIISASARSALTPLEFRNKLTRHGELRIDNCRKYDLGSGYRLISRKQGNARYFVFAGSHDDCDRWLERQRGKEPGLAGGELVAVAAPDESAPEEVCFPALLDAPDEYEAELTARLDDKTLRRVFRGICARRR